MKRLVDVSLGTFTSDALARGSARDDDVAAANVVQAIRSYLAGKRRGEPGWTFPSFLRHSKPGERVELRLNIDDNLWQSLQVEAATQGVTVRQMLEHAVFYFFAEVEAGRVTERIVGDLGLC